MNCILCESNNTTKIAHLNYCISCRSLFSDAEVPYITQDSRAIFPGPFVTGRGFDALVSYLNAHPDCTGIFSETSIYNYATKRGMVLEFRNPTRMIFSLPPKRIEDHAVIKKSDKEIDTKIDHNKE